MKNLIVPLFFIFLALQANANNLTISTPVYNDGAKTISFTIAWDNSWKISTGPANFDGVWVFVKRQACSSSNIWASALVSITSGDHTVTAATNLLTVDAVGDGMGVFIRRTSNGIGSIGTHTVTLKLNSSLTTRPSITPTALDNFKVFGVEMVYVPQAEFFIGDGRSVNSSNFSAGNNASTPLKIDAAKQAAGLGAASVYTSNSIFGCPNLLPSTFPLGYNGFWSMKYEINSWAYIDFLNCLTYVQQAKRFEKWGSRYPNQQDQQIAGAGQKTQTKVRTPGTYNTVPAVFGPYGTTEEVGKWSPASFLGWLDLTAYLDWSGLRPMTEFEYEKLCRGPLNPVANEYPWGNTLIYQPNRSYADNYTQFNEYWSVIADGTCKYGQEDDNWCPWRHGFAATATSTRSQSGATYYGIMEIGGNVWEQVVGGGSGYDYSDFTIANGDGALGDNGNANTVGWPTGFGANSGNYIKGGGYSWMTTTTHIQVSDRTFYVGTDYSNGQKNDVAGRGIRSFSY